MPSPAALIILKSFAPSPIAKAESEPPKSVVRVFRVFNLAVLPRIGFFTSPVSIPLTEISSLALCVSNPQASATLLVKK